MDTQVDPENLMSIWPLKSSSLQLRKALLKAMQISSVFSASSFLVFKSYSLYFENMNRNSASMNWGNLCFI